MTNAHTPGPWEVDDLLTINSPTTLMVAECSVAANRPQWSGTDYSTRAHQEANARLISGAPELLVAARAAWNCIAELAPTQARVEVVQLLQAAIERAAGEQP